MAEEKRTAAEIAAEEYKQRHRKKIHKIDKFFTALVRLKGSDLHLKADRPPYIRVGGDLKALNHPPISDEEMVDMLFDIMDDRNRRIFNDEGGADFAHVVEVDGVSWRFRVNILQQLGHMGLVARRVNNTIPEFEKLFLPQ